MTTFAIQLTDIGAELVIDSARPLFFGTYKCAVDRNGQMTLPAAFCDKLRRAGLHEIGAFTDDKRSRIKVYPLRRQAGVSEPQSTFVGAVGNNVALIATFKLGLWGRIRLPHSFLSAAGITDTAFVVGLGCGFDILHTWPTKKAEPSAP